MGMWVIFIGDAMFGLDTIRAMAFEEKVEIRNYGEKQFDVWFKGNHDAYVSFQFDYDGMIMSDYSPEELKNLPFENPQFILVRYSDIKLLERIISSDDFPKDIMIDCDGVDLGLEKFIEKSRLLGNQPHEK